jgi:hypothetical protein
MDHIAELLHERALVGGAGGRLGTCIPNRKSASLWGRDYQASRYIVGGQARSLLSQGEIEMRGLGREIAATLEQQFNDAGQETDFWRWALRINASGLTHQERDDFVTALSLALASGTSDLVEELVGLSSPNEIVVWNDKWLGPL